MKYIYSFLATLSPMAAYAQESAAAEGPGMSSLVIQLLIIFAIFYFLIIRPQQKKMKDHQDMASALSKGDKIITQGGIAGVVVSAKEGERFIEVEIASSVKVNVLRSTIAEKLSDDVKVKLVSSTDGKKEKATTAKAKKSPSKAASSKKSSTTKASKETKTKGKK